MCKAFSFRFGFDAENMKVTGPRAPSMFVDAYTMFVFKALNMQGSE